jgi:hypothetical protein
VRKGAEATGGEAATNGPSGLFGGAGERVEEGLDAAEPGGAAAPRATAGRPGGAAPGAAPGRGSPDKDARAGGTMRGADEEAERSPGRGAALALGGPAGRPGAPAFGSGDLEASACSGEVAISVAPSSAPSSSSMPSAETSIAGNEGRGAGASRAGGAAEEAAEATPPEAPTTGPVVTTAATWMVCPHLRHFIRSDLPATLSSEIWYFALQLSQTNFTRSRSSDVEGCFWEAEDSPRSCRASSVASRRVDP